MISNWPVFKLNIIFQLRLISDPSEFIALNESEQYYGLEVYVKSKAVKTVYGNVSLLIE